VSGSGPNLVWVHGLASCIEGDRDVIDAFARSFTVLAYDARGHGRSSPVTDAAAYSYTVLAHDLLGMLDHVGWDRAVLAGASMGAATAARVAAVAPDRVDALVMARPGAMGDDGRAPAWLQLLFAGGAHAVRNGGIEGAISYLMSIPIAREQLQADPSRLEQLHRDWDRHDPLSIAGALEGIPRTAPMDGGLTAESIVCPTLVIPGNDLIHPTDAGVAIAAMIPDAECATPFDGLARGREVDEMVALVRGFLQRRNVIA
jgi:pimeloyl-ACP methyl ester carboxylesterase